MRTLRQLVPLALVLSLVFPHAAVAASRWTVTVLKPTRSSVYYTRASKLAFSGLATGPGVTRVTVKVGTASAVNARLSSAGKNRYSWKTGTLRLRTGRNVVKVQAIARTGSSAVRTVVVTLDTKAPVVSLSSPVNGSSYGNASPPFTYAIDDATAQVAVVVDGATSSVRTGGVLGPLADGSHTIVVIATDRAGNKGTATTTFGVDTIAPTLTANPAGGLYSSTRSVTLTPSEQASMYYTLDGSTPTASSTLYTGPVTVSSSLTLKAIAVDRAGHTSSVYSYTYAIDTVVPVFSSARVIGALLTLTYSESLDASSVPGPEAFSIVVSGTPRTPDTVTISGATVSLHLKVPVFTPDKVVLSYTPGTPKLQDPAGNAVAPITSYPVTNDTPLLGGG